MSEAPEFTTRSHWRPTLIEWAVIIPVALLGLFFLISSIHRSQVKSRSIFARQNLKTIGLALSNYHGTHSTLPPGGVFSAQGLPYHCWTTSLAPYLDATPWYNQINFSIPWNDPSQLDRFITPRQPVWRNPLVTTTPRQDGLAVTPYAANSWTVFRNSSVTFKEIGELSSTMLMAEARGNYQPLGAPGNWRDVQLGLNTSDDGFGSHDRDYSWVLTADGRVLARRVAADSVIWNSLQGPKQLRPSAAELQRPEVPSDISKIPIWRYRSVYWESAFKIAAFRLAPDGKTLTVDFQRNGRLVKQVPEDCLAILQDLDRFGGIQHIQITGSLEAGWLEPFDWPQKLQTLTWSQAKVDGDTQPFRRQLRKSISVD